MHAVLQRRARGGAIRSRRGPARINSSGRRPAARVLPAVAADAAPRARGAPYLPDQRHRRASQQCDRWAPLRSNNAVASSSRFCRRRSLTQPRPVGRQDDRWQIVARARARVRPPSSRRATCRRIVLGSAHREERLFTSAVLLIRRTTEPRARDREPDSTRRSGSTRRGQSAGDRSARRQESTR